MRKVLKYIVPISISLGVILVGTAIFLFSIGSFTAEPQMPDKLVYGESFDASAEAFMSNIQYEYKLKGSDEWTTIVPTEPGDYVIRAVSTNVFGAKRYSEEKPFAVGKKNVEIKVSQGSVKYGEDPTVSAELVGDDTLIVEGLTFNYASLGNSVTDINVNLDSVKIMSKDGRDVTSSYYITTPVSQISVTQRPLSITIEKQSKNYNGKEITFTDYQFDESELVEGDVLQPHFTVSSTNVNENIEYEPVWKVFRNGVDVTAYYDIETSCGVLSVEKQPIRISIFGSTLTYNGTEQRVNANGAGYKVDEDDLKLLAENGHTISMTGSATFKEVGEYTNVIQFAIYDAAGNDVTANYSLQFAADTAKVVVEPRTVEIGLADVEGVYNGKPLDRKYYVLESGKLGSEISDSMWKTAENANDGLLVEVPLSETKHTLRFTLKGTLTNVGDLNYSTENISVVDASGNEIDIKNYDISKAHGSLKVTKRAITLIADSAEKLYDGTPLSKPTFTYNASELVAGQEIKAEVQGEVTDINPGVADNNKIVNPQIFSGTENVTANYDITCVPGTLTVESLKMEIHLDNSTGIYDGKPIDRTGKVVELGIGGGQSITAEFISVEGNNTVIIDLPEEAFASKVELTLEGNRTNVTNGVEGDSATYSVKSYKIYRDGKDVTGNCIVEVDASATLSVTPRAIKLVAPNKSKVSDGTPLKGSFGDNNTDKEILAGIAAVLNAKADSNKSYTYKDGEPEAQLICSVETLLAEGVRHNIEIVIDSVLEDSGNRNEDGVIVGDNKITSIKITDDQGNDVTANYDADIREAGTLKIDQNRIKVIVSNYSKIFDGKSLPTVYRYGQADSVITVYAEAFGEGYKQFPSELHYIAECSFEYSSTEDFAETIDAPKTAGEYYVRVKAGEVVIKSYADGTKVTSSYGFYSEYSDPGDIEQQYPATKVSISNRDITVQMFNSSNVYNGEIHQRQFRVKYWDESRNAYVTTDLCNIGTDDGSATVTVNGGELKLRFVELSDENVAFSEESHKNVGVVNWTLDKGSVTYEGNSVENKYTVACEYLEADESEATGAESAKATILPCEIEIRIYNASQLYNGEALNLAYSLRVNGSDVMSGVLTGGEDGKEFAYKYNGETITFTFEGESITNVGVQTWKYVGCEFAGEAKKDNYSVNVIVIDVFRNATADKTNETDEIAFLVVDPLKMTLVLNSVEKVYDGKETDRTFKVIASVAKTDEYKSEERGGYTVYVPVVEETEETFTVGESFTFWGETFTPLFSELTTNKNVTNEIWSFVKFDKFAENEGQNNTTNYIVESNTADFVITQKELFVRFEPINKPFDGEVLKVDKFDVGEIVDGNVVYNIKDANGEKELLLSTDERIKISVLGDGTNIGTITIRTEHNVVGTFTDEEQAIANGNYKITVDENSILDIFTQKIKIYLYSETQVFSNSYLKRQIGISFGGGEIVSYVVDAENKGNNTLVIELANNQYAKLTFSGSNIINAGQVEWGVESIEFFSGEDCTVSISDENYSIDWYVVDTDEKETEYENRYDAKATLKITKEQIEIDLYDYTETYNGNEHNREFNFTIGGTTCETNAFGKDNTVEFMYNGKSVVITFTSLDNVNVTGRKDWGVEQITVGGVEIINDTKNYDITYTVYGSEGVREGARTATFEIKQREITIDLISALKTYDGKLLERKFKFNGGAEILVGKLEETNLYTVVLDNNQTVVIRFTGNDILNVSESGEWGIDGEVEFYSVYSDEKKESVNASNYNVTVLVDGEKADEAKAGLKITKADITVDLLSIEETYSGTYFNRTFKLTFGESYNAASIILAEHATDNVYKTELADNQYLKLTFDGEDRRDATLEGKPETWKLNSIEFFSDKEYSNAVDANNYNITYKVDGTVNAEAKATIVIEKQTVKIELYSIKDTYKGSAFDRKFSVTLGSKLIAEKATVLTKGNTYTASSDNISQNIELVFDEIDVVNAGAERAWGVNTVKITVKTAEDATGYDATSNYDITYVVYGADRKEVDGATDATLKIDPKELTIKLYNGYQIYNGNALARTFSFIFDEKDDNKNYLDQRVSVGSPNELPMANGQRVKITFTGENAVNAGTVNWKVEKLEFFDAENKVIDNDNYAVTCKIYDADRKEVVGATDATLKIDPKELIIKLYNGYQIYNGNALARTFSFIFDEKDDKKNYLDQRVSVDLPNEFTMANGQLIKITFTNSDRINAGRYTWSVGNVEFSDGNGNKIKNSNYDITYVVADKIENGADVIDQDANGTATSTIDPKPITIVLHNGHKIYDGIWLKRTFTVIFDEDAEELIHGSGIYNGTVEANNNGRDYADAIKLGNGQYITLGFLGTNNMLDATAEAEWYLKEAVFSLDVNREQLISNYNYEITVKVEEGEYSYANCENAKATLEVEKETITIDLYNSIHEYDGKKIYRQYRIKRGNGEFGAYVSALNNSTVNFAQSQAINGLSVEITFSGSDISDVNDSHMWGVESIKLKPDGIGESSLDNYNIIYFVGGEEVAEGEEAKASMTVIPKNVTVYLYNDSKVYDNTSLKLKLQCQVGDSLSAMYSRIDGNSIIENIEVGGHVFNIPFNGNGAENPTDAGTYNVGVNVGGIIPHPAGLGAVDISNYNVQVIICNYDEETEEREIVEDATEATLTIEKRRIQIAIPSTSTTSFTYDGKYHMPTTFTLEDLNATYTKTHYIVYNSETGVSETEITLGKAPNVTIKLQFTGALKDSGSSKIDIGNKEELEKNFVITYTPRNIYVDDAYIEYSFVYTDGKNGNLNSYGKVTHKTYDGETSRVSEIIIHNYYGIPAQTIKVDAEVLTQPFEFEIEGVNGEMLKLTLSNWSITNAGTLYPNLAFSDDQEEGVSANNYGSSYYSSSNAGRSLFVITKRPVKVVTGEATIRENELDKVGGVLTNSDIEVSAIDGMVESGILEQDATHLIFTTTGSIASIGRIENTYEVSAAAGYEYLVGNYEFHSEYDELGALIVVGGTYIKVDVEDNSKTYDANRLYAEKITLTFNEEDPLTITEYVISDDQLSSAFVAEYANGTKIRVTVRSTDGNVKYDEKDVATGATTDITVEIMYEGESDFVKIDPDDFDDTYDLEVDKEFKLKVDPIKLSIKTFSKTFTYNGKTQYYPYSDKDPGYEIVSGELLPGHTFKVIRGTGVSGSYSTHYINNYSIVDELGNSVKDNYAITWSRGSLTVERIQMVIYTDGAEKTYDGKLLSTSKIKIEFKDHNGVILATGEYDINDEEIKSGVGILIPKELTDNKEFRFTFAKNAITDVKDSGYDTISGFQIKNVAQQETYQYKNGYFDGAGFSDVPFKLVIEDENLGKLTVKPIEVEVEIADQDREYNGGLIVDWGGIKVKFDSQETWTDYIFEAATKNSNVIEVEGTVVNGFKIDGGVEVDTHEKLTFTFQIFDSTGKAAGTHMVVGEYTLKLVGVKDEKNATVSIFVNDEDGISEEELKDVESNYYVVVTKEGAITVNPWELNIVIKDVDSTYGVTDFSSIKLTDGYMSRYTNHFEIRDGEDVITLSNGDRLYITCRNDVSINKYETVQGSGVYKLKIYGDYTLSVRDSSGRNDVSSNYILTVVEGNINITPRDVEIGFNKDYKDNYEREYNGQNVIFDPAHVEFLNLLDGHKVTSVTYKWSDVTGINKATDTKHFFGTLELRIDSIKIVDAEGKDVTKNYSIENTVLKSVITPKVIKSLTTSSASKANDGTALTRYSLSDKGGILDGHYISGIEYIGTQTYIGWSENKVDVKNTHLFITDREGNNVSAYYDLSALEDEKNWKWGILTVYYQNHDNNPAIKLPSANISATDNPDTGVNVGDRTSVNDSTVLYEIILENTAATRLYFKQMSYGAYTGKGWQYVDLDLNYSAPVISSGTLYSASVKYKAIYNFIAPYYLASAYNNQIDDVHMQHVSEKGDVTKFEYYVISDWAKLSVDDTYYYEAIKAYYTALGEGEDEKGAINDYLATLGYSYDGFDYYFTPEGDFEPVDTIFSATNKNDVLALIDAIANSMQTEFTYNQSYSTTSSSVVTTILNGKRGNAQQIATAATMLFRAMGVPARYTVGYAVDATDSTYQVTGADAHAWVEVYVKGIGWRCVEVTPSPLNGGGNGSGNDGTKPGFGSGVTGTADGNKEIITIKPTNLQMGFSGTALVADRYDSSDLQNFLRTYWEEYRNGNGNLPVDYNEVFRVEVSYSGSQTNVGTSNSSITDIKIYMKQYSESGVEQSEKLVYDYTDRKGELFSKICFNLEEGTLTVKPIISVIIGQTNVNYNSEKYTGQYSSSNSVGEGNIDLYDVLEIATQVGSPEYFGNYLFIKDPYYYMDGDKEQGWIQIKIDFTISGTTSQDSPTLGEINSELHNMSYNHPNFDCTFAVKYYTKAEFDALRAEIGDKTDIDEINEIVEKHEGANRPEETDRYYLQFTTEDDVADKNEFRPINIERYSLDVSVNDREAVTWEDTMEMFPLSDGTTVTILKKKEFDANGFVFDFETDGVIGGVGFEKPVDSAINVDNRITSLTVSKDDVILESITVEYVEKIGDTTYYRVTYTDENGYMATTETMAATKNAGGVEVFEFAGACFNFRWSNNVIQVNP